MGIKSTWVYRRNNGSFCVKRKAAVEAGLTVQLILAKGKC